MSERRPNKLPEQSTRENVDVFTLGEEHLDLHRIRNLSSELPATDIPIASLDTQVRSQSWDDESATDISPSNFLDEIQHDLSLLQILNAHPNWENRIRRIQMADYSHPILIYKGVIIDGLHRILHARIDGKETVLAHNLDSLPADAFVSDEFMQGLE